MALPIVSRYIVYPEEKSVMEKLKLSTIDLVCLQLPYAKKGNLFESPPFETSELILRLKTALSRTLTYFPHLAGRLTTDDEGFIYITCGEEGAELIHADGSNLTVKDLTESADGELPEVVDHCFPVEPVMGVEGFSKSVLIVQVMELADGVSITVNVNHGIVDGVSIMNFYNSFAELSRGLAKITRLPDFHRDSVLMSNVVPKISWFPSDYFSSKTLLKEKIFKFGNESIRKLKTRINKTEGNNIEISSLQCLFALLWSAITRARKLPPSKTTTFTFAVNCRHRMEPKLDPFYFGNAAQTIIMTATAEEIIENGLFWCAKKFNDKVAAYDFVAVKSRLEALERNQKALNLENFDGTIISVASSPRFSMYENDFGWGKPIGLVNRIMIKRDGMAHALSGRDGGIDLQVILAPDTMMNLEADPEFTMYLS